jgi:hypothetical protein
LNGTCAPLSPSTSAKYSRHGAQRCASTSGAAATISQLRLLAIEHLSGLRSAAVGSRRRGVEVRVAVRGERGAIPGTAVRLRAC